MVKSSEKKSFTITLEKHEDTLLTSISADTNIEPKDMFDGLLGGLAALYISVWGQPQAAARTVDADLEDDLSPEEFCQLVVNKVLARLESYSVAQGTVQ